jgi:preprotein translocase subunit SecG
MENVVLVIHLMLAFSLIGAVLLQRSEGGGLGIGGGGGGAGSSRPASTAMAKVTWVLAIGFICTSSALTIVAAQKAGSGSVVDRLGVETPTATGTSTPDLGTDLLPPSGDDAPLVPSGN